MGEIILLKSWNASSHHTVEKERTGKSGQWSGEIRVSHLLTNIEAVVKRLCSSQVATSSVETEQSAKKKRKMWIKFPEKKHGKTMKRVKVKGNGILSTLGGPLRCVGDSGARLKHQEQCDDDQQRHHPAHRARGHLHFCKKLFL